MAVASTSQTPSITYTLSIRPTEEVNEIYRAIKEKTDETYKFMSMKVTIDMNGSKILTSLIAVHKIDTNLAIISVEQAKVFSDQNITSAICKVCPNLFSIIRTAGHSGIQLPFTEHAKAPLLIPLTKEVAANVILAFFNSYQDPLDRISQVVDMRKEGARAEAGRILTTYYLSCIKYLTNLNLVEKLAGDRQCEAMLDDTQLVSSRQRHAYQGLKQIRREIPKELVAFHAVYGAYVMCRPVATKRSFREWIGKRYSSFLASIQYAPESNINLTLQSGGTQVNETVVERPIVRQIVYDMTKIESDNIILSAIKNHVGFLTSLSEMTTYSLIQQVLIQGGAVVALSPMARQVANYADERNAISNMMAREGIPNKDIVYLHLIKPNLQCFKSASYPDLIKTAQIIDQLAHPGEKTLENYKAKTQGATCDEAKVRQFLRAQSGMYGLKIDSSDREKIRGLLGDATDALYDEAQQIVNLINKQTLTG